MTLLVAALLLLQREPALELSAEVRGGTFVCGGTTDLPDKARLKITVAVPRAEGPYALAVRNVEATGGKFEVELQAFEKEAFPGTYVLFVVFDPQLQRGDLGLAFASREASVEVPGDTVAAQHRFFNELRAAAELMSRLRDERPADWSARALGRMEPLLARTEARMMGILEKIREALGTMYVCIEQMPDLSEEERAERNKQFDEARTKFLAFLDEIGSDPERGMRVLDELEAALKAGRPVESLLMDLGSALGQEHHPTVVELAARVQSRDLAGAASAIRGLRENVRGSKPE